MVVSSSKPKSVIEISTKNHIDWRLLILLQSGYKPKDIERADAFILELPNVLHFPFYFLLKSESHLNLLL